MQSTFVPSEISRQNRPMGAGPVQPYPELRSRATAPAGSVARYRLFRRRHEPELHCAVPQGQPVPAFLRSDLWQAVGELDETSPMPLGFDREAARIGSQINGFYLFIAFEPIPGPGTDGADQPWQMARGGSAPSALLAN